MTKTTQKSGAGPAPSVRAVHRGVALSEKISYMSRWLPSYFWQSMVRRRPQGKTHLIFSVADHFEPAIVPQDGKARAPYAEQERRLERWCHEYPRRFEKYRDAEGRPLVHTYFYPAEQYDQPLVARLAEHCHTGWGEIEIHLHHGLDAPDSAENTRRQLVEFRDRLADGHACLSYCDESSQPRYAFVHGNFALANSNRGRLCGVDNEMQILAETGCYADMTLPTSAFHAAQIGKINSIYECGLPLEQRTPHRTGRDLAVGQGPQVFPIVVQGPLMLDYGRFHIDNAALTGPNPATLHRLSLWKRAAITVSGRPDWLFIKLHCHGMDPRDEEAILGAAMLNFVQELTDGAQGRNEVVHFVSAREMVNIILAACDGREGTPGDYLDYRLRRVRPASSPSPYRQTSAVALKG
jgi:uncharacterized protein YuzB (UPF0349 family)